MSDIVEFLTARLDEDERAARRPGGYGRARWVYDRETFRVLAPDARGGGVVAARRGRGEDSHPLLDVDGEHIARHDPARVLAEVKAKRRQIDMTFRHAATIDGEWGCCHSADEIARGDCPGTPIDEIPMLRLLALPYAQHDGYRPEWRPYE